MLDADEQVDYEELGEDDNENFVDPVEITDTHADIANVGKSSVLFFSNIPPSATGLELRRLCEKYGAVKDIDFHVGKRISFVTLASDEDAVKVKRELHGSKALGSSYLICDFKRGISRRVAEDSRLGSGEQIGTTTGDRRHGDHDRAAYHNHINRDDRGDRDLREVTGRHGGERERDREQWGERGGGGRDAKDRHIQETLPRSDGVDRRLDGRGGRVFEKRVAPSASSEERDRDGRGSGGGSGGGGGDLRDEARGLLLRRMEEQQHRIAASSFSRTQISRSENDRFGSWSEADRGGRDMRERERDTRNNRRGVHQYGYAPPPVHFPDSGVRSNRGDSSRNRGYDYDQRGAPLPYPQQGDHALRLRDGPRSHHQQRMY